MVVSLASQRSNSKTVGHCDIGISEIGTVRPQCTRQFNSNHNLEWRSRLVVHRVPRLDAVNSSSFGSRSNRSICWTGEEEVGVLGDIAWIRLREFKIPADHATSRQQRRGPVSWRVHWHRRSHQVVEDDVIQRVDEFCVVARSPMRRFPGSRRGPRPGSHRSPDIAQSRRETR